MDLPRIMDTAKVDALSRAFLAGDTDGVEDIRAQAIAEAVASAADAAFTELVIRASFDCFHALVLRRAGDLMGAAQVEQEASWTYPGVVLGPAFDAARTAHKATDLAASAALGGTA